MGNQADTISARLFARAKAHPNDAAYFEKEGGVWRATSWAGYAKHVETAGRALLALGVKRGDVVCILGFNRPEWVIADVAAMSIGGAAAGIYTTCSSGEVQYIVNHAEAPIVVVENAAQFDKIAKERDRLPHLKKVVLMRGARVDDPLAITWEEFLALGDSVPASRFHEELAALDPEGLSTLIYTSGTTGPPKAVMLSHKSLAWTAVTARTLIDGREGEIMLSYLPLSHIAEQMFTIHGPITIGITVYFAESIEKVVDNLKEVRPTILFGVPRIWEKMHASIATKVAGAKGAKKIMADWARGVGRESAPYRLRGKPMPALIGAKYALASKVVFSKVKAAAGLDRARVCVSGAAPIAKEVLEFLDGLDLTVNEVYGQSEDCGPTTFNMPGDVKLGTVGVAIPGTDVKIAADGEILVRGPHVFMGYYKDEAATAETLEDGWLHTGDLGSFDSEGFLTITGRKKEIIITAGGKNIAPKNIEAAIKNHPLVGEAVVIGDRRKYLTVLVTLDPEAVERFAAEKQISPESFLSSGIARAEVQRAIDEANAELARVEQVKKFTILPRPFTIDAGELTPTLKIKRNVVAKRFSDEIEAMYAGDATD